LFFQEGQIHLISSGAKMKSSGSDPLEKTSARLRGAFVSLLLVMVAGCGTVYINEADRDPVYRKETDFTSSRNTEMTYRRIYTMLYRCTSGYYRVQGNYDPDSRHAEIAVDTGAGFENDLYLADSHVMRIIIEADGIEKSRVQVKQTNRHGAPYAGAIADWVNEGSDDCAAGS
jgi:hypothetical protein